MGEDRLLVTAGEYRDMYARAEMLAFTVRVGGYATAVFLPKDGQAPGGQASLASVGRVDFGPVRARLEGTTLHHYDVPARTEWDDLPLE